MKTSYVCNTATRDALPLPAWSFGSPATNATNRKHGTSTPEAGKTPVPTNEQHPADPSFGPGPDELEPEQALPAPKWTD
jgi:hypothetical protein